MASSDSYLSVATGRYPPADTFERQNTLRNGPLAKAYLSTLWTRKHSGASVPTSTDAAADAIAAPTVTPCRVGDNAVLAGARHCIRYLRGIEEPSMRERQPIAAEPELLKSFCMWM